MKHSLVKLLLIPSSLMLIGCNQNSFFPISSESSIFGSASGVESSSDSSSIAQISSNDEEESDVSGLLITKKNAITPNEDYYESYNVESFYDDTYYYYIFDMGIAVNVPLTDTFQYHYYSGKGKLEESFTTVETNTTSLNRCITSQLSKMYSHTTKNGWSLGGSSKTTFKLWKFKESITISGEYHKDETDITSTEEAWLTSFSECESFSKTTERTRKVIFDETCQKGFYSYRYVGVVNTFIGVKVDIDSYKKGDTQIYIDNYNLIKAYGYLYDYDPDDVSFSKNYSDQKIEFDCSVLDDIPLPTTYIGKEATIIDDIEEDKFEGYIKINTVDEFNDAMNSSTANNKYVLLNDIDFQGRVIHQFGNFEGLFDGNGHSIKGYAIANSNVIDSGLFKQVKKGATIKRLTIDNASVKTNVDNGSTSEADIGVIAGKNYGLIDSCIVKNSKLDGYIKYSPASAKYVKLSSGAVVGINEGEIYNCQAISNNINTVTNGDSTDGYVEANTGGICGMNYNNDAIVQKCISQSNTLASNTKGGKTWTFIHAGMVSRCGGLIGYNASKVMNCDSYSSNSLSATYTVLHGVVDDYSCKNILIAKNDAPNGYVSDNNIK